MRTAPVLLAALAATSLTSGCTALAVAGAATVFVAKDRTLGEGLDETTGGAEVRAKLLAADFGVYSRISVEMSRGRLLLAGAVPTLEHKIEAERIAWTVVPVREVANDLEIGPRPDLWRASWDAWITTEIRTRFMAEDAVKAINFNVETHRGVVYLMGVARRESELEAAVDIARRINGVEKVVSYIELRPLAPEQTARFAPLRREQELNYLQARAGAADPLAPDEMQPTPAAVGDGESGAPLIVTQR